MKLENFVLKHEVDLIYHFLEAEAEDFKSKSYCMDIMCKSKVTHTH